MAVRVLPQRQPIDSTARERGLAGASLALDPDERATPSSTDVAGALTSASSSSRPAKT
ncbi:hypothetical protein [Trebonia sp.]|uniref:hypothetical protein n=1 Tax=Trebonia sp. TaxID=2767075 RepID=UPI00262CBA19|nr:hypothetical protein [Trebonia sp.]